MSYTDSSVTETRITPAVYGACHQQVVIPSHLKSYFAKKIYKWRHLDGPGWGEGAVRGYPVLKHQMGCLCACLCHISPLMVRAFSCSHLPPPHGFRPHSSPALDAAVTWSRVGIHQVGRALYHSAGTTSVLPSNLGLPSASTKTASFSSLLVSLRHNCPIDIVV